jgi:hypothetical protein
MTSMNDVIKQSLYSAKLSRLLATENINVEFSDTAKTASFAPHSRTLTFPYNTFFMDHDIHELFMYHEVSHALHLPADTFERIKKSGVSPDLFNVVVDIRDERLIKSRYPSAASVMNRAYGKIIEQNFFGKIDEIPHMNFASRLNVFAKCGPKHAHFIKFTPAELEFYAQCMQVESFDDVLTLSKKLEELNDESTVNIDQDLMDYVQSTVERMMQEEKEKNAELSEEDTDLNGVSTPADFKEETPDDERQRRIDEMVERIRNARTQAMFDEAFNEGALTNTLVISHAPVSRKAINTISAKEYADACKKFWGVEKNSAGIAKITESVRTMRKDIQTSVDVMVKIFEAKKAAARYRNTQVTDTGLINVNKIYRYKFDNKVFRSAAKIPNDKNHAYFIMVDFSGSMKKTINSAIEQIMVITEFFRRIQVPYKVCAFGAQPHYTMLNEVQVRNGFTSDQTSDTSSLARYVYWDSSDVFEVLNSEQTNQEHNVNLTGLFNSARLNLGSTPTMSAMLKAEHVANEFFAAHRADKRNLIVITDGEPTDTQVTRYSSGLKAKTILLCDAHSKNIVTTRSGCDYGIINAMGRMFEMKYGINFMSISITKSLSQNLTSAFVSSDITSEQSTQFKNEGYVDIKDPWTKKSVFFAKPFNVDNDVGDIEVASNATASQLSRALLRNLKGIKKSRSFLNALATSLA